jgi:hypothetical protein
MHAAPAAIANFGPREYLPTPTANSRHEARPYLPAPPPALNSESARPPGGRSGTCLPLRGACLPRDHTYLPPRRFFQRDATQAACAPRRVAACVAPSSLDPSGGQFALTGGNLHAADRDLCYRDDRDSRMSNWCLEGAGSGHRPRAGGRPRRRRHRTAAARPRDARRRARCPR